MRYKNPKGAFEKYVYSKLEYNFPVLLYNIVTYSVLQTNHITIRGQIV